MTNQFTELETIADKELLAASGGGSRFRHFVGDTINNMISKKGKLTNLEELQDLEYR